MLKWSCCVFILILIIYVSQIQCGFFSSGSRSSSSSGSRGSSSSGSRGSSSSGSRGSSSSGSWGSSSSGSRGSSSSGSRGSSSSGSWGSSSLGSHSSNYRTTPRPNRYYPVTTMPTRRTTKYYPVTTMPTRRTTKYHPITTMPTKRTTRYQPITTMPTKKTTYTKQPPYNPNFTPGKTNYSSGITPTKQPPYNPFFTSHSSGSGTTKQPSYNPFFSTTVRTTKQPQLPNYRNNTSSSNNRFNATLSNNNNGRVTEKPNWMQTTKLTPLGNGNYGTGSSTTKQPAYNPYFSTSTKQPQLPNYRNNTSNSNNRFNATSSNNNNGRVTEKPNWMQTTKLAPLGNGNYGTGSSTTKQPAYNPYFSTSTKQPQLPNYRNNTSNSNNRFNATSSNNNYGRVTEKPNWMQTTKLAPLGNGNYGTGNIVQTPRPVYTTKKPVYQGPFYNTSSSFKPGLTSKPGSGGVYQPPSVHRNNTYHTGSGISPSYPVYPVQPPPQTTIINNNHYYGRPSYYTPGVTGGRTHVTIINNNYNPNHHVIIPSTHYYSYGPPAIGISVVNTNQYDPFITSHYHTTYHYSTYDTGSSSIGFFLGYQLGRINRPSYYYHSTAYVNQEYVPRYDHYTVHHYYHNVDNIPKEAPIQPNAVVVCAGDSGNLCPPGNYPLCTNNGAVMCVVSASSTVPCSNTRNLNCVTSTIPCQGNNSPECQQKTSASVSIPCVSTASIAAGVSYVNNSIVVTDASDSSVKNFCVTVLAIPTKNETNTETKKTSIEAFVPFQYTTNITGVDILGYYLGYKLQNLVQPGYSYLNYDENYNYIEKFDHYDVFQYYHGANFLTKEVEFKSEQIMNCPGDSGTFCPQFTLSLCLNDGSVACVADMSSTAFNNDTQVNYFNSTIACDKLKSPVCLANPVLTVPVQIPCISTAKVYANVSFMVRNFKSGTEDQYYRTIELMQNDNSSLQNGNSSTQNISTTQNVTTTREFCVAVLAVPGEKLVSISPERRKISGVPNAGEYLGLPKYTYKPIGNTTIAAYLAYKLGKLAYPSYYFMNAFWFSSTGVIQKYDHYTPISYYNSKESIPKYLEFQSFDLRACEGDSGLICPTNTSAICLNDGGVMCLTDLMLTVPCLKYNETVCVRSTVSCENNNPCVKSTKSKRVSVPCISTATIYGDVMSVKNSIYKRVPASAKSYTDLQAIPGSNVNNTPVYHKAQQFCVTLVALPAERIITEGEKFFESSDSLFARITSKMFG